jgi:hypothetical protein
MASDGLGWGRMASDGLRWPQMASDGLRWRCRRGVRHCRSRGKPAAQRRVLFMPTDVRAATKFCVTSGSQRPLVTRVRANFVSPVAGSCRLRVGSCRRRTRAWMAAHKTTPHWPRMASDGLGWPQMVSGGVGWPQMASDDLRWPWRRGHRHCRSRGKPAVQTTATGDTGPCKFCVTSGWFVSLACGIVSAACAHMDGSAQNHSALASDGLGWPRVASGGVGWPQMASDDLR